MTMPPDSADRASQVSYYQRWYQSEPGTDRPAAAIELASTADSKYHRKFGYLLPRIIVRELSDEITLPATYPASERNLVDRRFTNFATNTISAKIFPRYHIFTFLLADSAASTIRMASTVSFTSWTLIIVAPCIAASTAQATLPMTR